MKKIIFLLGVFLFTTGAYSQIDQSNTSVRAPGSLMTPQTGSEGASLLKSPGNHSLSNKNGMLNSQSDSRDMGEEEQTFSMRTDNGLMTYKLKDFKPKAFKDKEIKAEYRSDQYLGDLTTGGSNVELY